MSSQYTILPATVQSVHHSVLPMFSQNTTSTAHVQSQDNISCKWPVNTPSLLSMCSQNTISSTYFQLVHYLSCPCFCQYTSILLQSTLLVYTISLVHFQSEYHLYCPCPPIILQLLPISSKYNISTTHVQYILHIYSPCPIFITSPSNRARANLLEEDFNNI